MLSIKDYKIFFGPFLSHEELKVGAVVKIENKASRIIDDFTLRLWIEGLNSKREPVQLVIVEHLYLKPGLENISNLSGVLFYPLITEEGKPYYYTCTLELLDKHEKVVERHREKCRIQMP